MIISHSQQFIFIANRKNASKAIGITFSSTCSQRDVITPLERDESIRRELVYLAPRNFIPLRKSLRIYSCHPSANHTAERHPKNSRRLASILTSFCANT